MSLRYGPHLRERIRDNLARFPRRTHDDSSLRAAAVTMVLIDDEQGRGCFVLTKRPRTMRRHAGQYALPGGRLDAGETAEQAALRETQEEIGLELPSDRILGSLDDYPTRSGFCITPVVVWGGMSPALTPNPDEVASLYRVPLAHLLDPDPVRLDHVPGITTPDGQPVLSLALLDHRIFAPTAALLLQLREVALLGKDTAVDGYDQPRFAWR
jgi:8-oxo-dGTP pyrophosphatase MutT (NUDIX family)